MWTERNRIELAGHKGFIKLALRKRVPVIPVVSHGGHESSIVLTRGRFIARALRLERFRTYSMPLALTIPWGLVIGPVPSIPIPTKVTLQVCDPMDWGHRSPEDAEDPRVLEQCYDEIHSVMQHALDQLAKEYPHPVAARITNLVKGLRPRHRASAKGT